MAENRIAREDDTRETNTRKKSWAPPQLLPEPKPEEGYAYRWIRLSSLGNLDATNISAKLREGWEPVAAKDQQHMQLVADLDTHERFKDNIVVGGLILCRAPQEMVDERNDYYNQQSKAQMESVDNNLMRENDARMPLFNERKTKITFGSGK